jgi:hypothetical protein
MFQRYTNIAAGDARDVRRAPGIATRVRGVATRVRGARCHTD